MNSCTIALARLYYRNVSVEECPGCANVEEGGVQLTHGLVPEVAPVLEEVVLV